MIKIIIFFILITIVVQCVEFIPPAAEIRKIIKDRQDAIELKHRRMVMESEEHNRRIEQEKQQQEEDRVRAREIARTTIKQTMHEYCDDHRDETISIISDIAEHMKESAFTKNYFYQIPPTVGVCIMKMLMDSTYHVNYVPENMEINIDLDKRADESRIEMKKSQMCDDDILYAIPCGPKIDDCLLFQIEFSKCMDGDNEYDYCFNVHDYTGMEEVGRISHGWVCL